MLFSWLKSKLLRRPPEDVPEAQPLEPLQLSLAISDEDWERLKEDFNIKKRVRPWTLPNAKGPLEAQQEYLEITSGGLTAEGSALPRLVMNP